jgi:predicted secreted protein
MRALIAAVLLAPLLASGQAPETLFNLVTLGAQAEREVPNDLLHAVLAAEAEGSDPAPLADNVNRAMQRALATAQGTKGVKSQSGGYQSYPVYDKGRVVRWRVRQELRLESGDFAAASELIGKLQASLVVTGLSLSVAPETRRKTENALMGEAYAAFEERARVARDAMKAKGFRVRDVNFSAGGGAVARQDLALARSMAASSPQAPAIEPGSTRILITVSGTVQLQ